MWNEKLQVSVGYAPDYAGLGLVGDARSAKGFLPALASVL